MEASYLVHVWMIMNIQLVTFLWRLFIPHSIVNVQFTGPRFHCVTWGEDHQVMLRLFRVLLASPNHYQQFGTLTQLSLRKTKVSKVPDHLCKEESV